MGHFKSAASLFFLFLMLMSISADFVFQKKTCPGPIAYYKDLGCIPLYKSHIDSCPHQYDCNNLPRKSSYECYGNNKYYPSHQIDLNCAPIYNYDQSPQADCTYVKRCQHKYDEVISRNLKTNYTESNNVVCIFGSLLMYYGDELSIASPTSACVRCVCEVGPVPTCQIFPPTRCIVKFMPHFEIDYSNIIRPISYYLRKLERLKKKQASKMPVLIDA